MTTLKIKNADYLESQRKKFEHSECWSSYFFKILYNLTPQYDHSNQAKLNYILEMEMYSRNSEGSSQYEIEEWFGSCPSCKVSIKEFGKKVTEAIGFFRRDEEVDQISVKICVVEIKIAHQESTQYSVINCDNLKNREELRTTIFAI